MALQLSGAHMHANSDGFHTAPRVTHVHSQITSRQVQAAHRLDEEIGGFDHEDDPDHEGDRDVSVVELKAGGAKLPVFLIWLGPALHLLPRVGDRISTLFLVPRLNIRRARWRPPSRAPPRFLN